MFNRFFAFLDNFKDFKGIDKFAIQAINPGRFLQYLGGKMKTISLRLPDSIHKKVKEITSQDGISINQFIASATAEKLSAYLTDDYLKERTNR